MTKTRKFVIGGIGLVVLVAGIGFWSCIPSQEIKLDALAAGAKQAVLDVDREYAPSNGYCGYVLRGDFDFKDLRSRIGNVGPAVLDMDQVHAVDWRKEQGIVVGWGPQYVYRRNDTGQRVLVMKVTLTSCWRYGAEVRIGHYCSGAVYTLSRWPGQPWRITDAQLWQIPD